MFFKPKDWPWPVENGVQASLLSDILTQEGIPHKVIRHGEALWGYAEQVSAGYGHLETAPEFAERLAAIYRDFLVSEHPEPEEID